MGNIMWVILHRAVPIYDENYHPHTLPVAEMLTQPIPDNLQQQPLPSHDIHSITQLCEPRES